MSYLNGNNVYGSKAISESTNKSYNKKPIEAIHYDDVDQIQNHETSNACETNQMRNTSCNYKQDNSEDDNYVENNRYAEHNHGKEKHCAGHNDKEMCCTGHSNEDNCSSICKPEEPPVCKCSCELVDPDCNFNCNAQNNCCNRKVAEFDCSLVEPVCTYLNLIFDEEKACGTTFFVTIDTSTLPLVSMSSQFQPACGCVTPCMINNTSIFTIESTKVCIKNFSFVGTIANTSILVNGVPVLGATVTASGIDATVSPAVLDKHCGDKCKGTKASVLLNNLEPWSFVAQYDLCGKVSTNGNICKFHVVIENFHTLPVVVTTPSTFIAPEVCLPSNDPTRPVTINATFCATGQLINPVLVIDADNTSLTLTGNLMLTTSADIQSMQSTKTCFQAVLPHCNKCKK